VFIRGKLPLLGSEVWKMLDSKRSRRKNHGTGDQYYFRI